MDGHGGRIRAVREFWHLSQRELAAGTGYSQSYVARLERGEMTGGGSCFLCAVAERFGVDLQWLEEGTGPDPFAGRDRRTAGERAAAERKARRMSQAELSEAAGINRSQLSRIETGAVRPTGSTLRRIAEALDVEEDWLRTGHGEKRRSEMTEIYGMLERDPEMRGKVIRFLKRRYGAEMG